MRHQDTIGLFNYWNEIRGKREAPLRSDVSAAALGRLLPSVMLLDQRDDGEIVVRLAGTRVCSLRCRELKGSLFANLFRDEDSVALAKILRTVARSSALVVLDTIADTGDGLDVPMEIGLFPLTDKATRILGIASTKESPYWLGAKPAKLQLRGIRYIDTHSDLPFLHSRPSVPVDNARKHSEPGIRERLRLLRGNAPKATKSALRIFTVHDGGKK